MSDIVERLRDKHCCDDTCYCDEAAAAIERLRAELETANANCDRMAALAIDNAKDTLRLRAALERIAANTYGFEPNAMSDIVERLRETAQCADYVVGRETAAEAADEITRLRAGGCARDQGTTQYCAEAAILAEKVGKLEAEAHSLTEESNRLRTAVQVTATTLHETDRQSDRLTAEVERLRAALESVMKAGVYDSACECISCEGARAALGGDND